MRRFIVLFTVVVAFVWLPAPRPGDGKPDATRISLSDVASGLKQQKIASPQQPELNDTKHIKGIVSMARGDDPASATTSFFICTGDSAALDGKYTAFGRVVDGMAVVEAIEASPRNGEAPVTRIELKTVRVERVP